MSDQEPDASPSDRISTSSPNLVVAISTLIWPVYRLDFLDELERRVREAGGELVIFDGGVDFNTVNQSAQGGRAPRRHVTNRFFCGRRFVLQMGSIPDLVKADTAVLQLSVRILSNWPVLILRRLLGRRTLLWGHAWPRSGRGTRGTLLRNVMRRLADAQITYGPSESAELAKYVPWLRTWPAPNAIFKKHEIDAPPFGNDIIYVGRLVGKKKISLLVEAFALARETGFGLGNLRIVGWGPDKDEITNLAERLSVANEVLMLGPVNDAAELRSLYAGTFCAISPGYVGLSATQAAGFGRPLVYPEDEPHAPEVAIVAESWSVTFDAGSARSLADAIRRTYAARNVWAIEAQQMSEYVRQHYTVEAMAAGFANALFDRDHWNSAERRD